MDNTNIENTDATSTVSTKTEPMIEVKNLSKSFDGQIVLSDVSFELKKGENLVILGKSGSGKSVLIKCIVRLLKSDNGTINVLGQDVSTLNTKNLGELRKKIGFLFQSGALYDSMTVKENLEFVLHRMESKLTEEEMAERIHDALENVGLANVLDKMPSQLSGGMRKRISLARTVVVNPLIMLYDEPTTGLDPVTSAEISLLINEVKKKYKTSSIIITHDIECARTTADRVIMLQDGQVYAEGKFNQFEKSTDSLINAFLK